MIGFLRWMGWWVASAVRSNMPSPALRAVAHPSAPQTLDDLNARSWRAQEGR